MAIVTDTQQDIKNLFGYIPQIGVENISQRTMQQKRKTMARKKAKAKDVEPDKLVKNPRARPHLKKFAVKPGEVRNPNGRPKGSRNKLSEDFLKDFHDAWQEHGKNSLKQMATDKPAEFVKAAVQLMPRDLHVKADASEAFVKIWERIVEIDEMKVIDGMAESVDSEQKQPIDVRSARSQGNA